MVAPVFDRRGKSELYRAGWFVTRTPGDRRKVPQKTYRPDSIRVRLKRRGKSSPLPWRHGRQGKPHPEQDQIGRCLRAARPRSPGRLQEVLSDQHPSEMIMTLSRGQNSAYSPLLFFFTHSSLALLCPQAGHLIRHYDTSVPSQPMIEAWFRR